MARRAAQRVNRGRTAQPDTLPAPVGGLNGRDGLANMGKLDAFVLDNFFPNSTSVDTRGGSRDYKTGLGAPVRTLAIYAGGGTAQMLAFANGSIYDVTAAGPLGAPLASGRISDDVSTVMFSNAGNQFLLGFSGIDPPFSYDGAVVTDLAITGLTGSQNTLHCAEAFKGRVYLAQQGQLGFYYLAVGAIQGAASYFDLSQVAKKGGHLVGITSFSQQDAGSGPADYIMFMTSEGEYIVYAGFDPSNADNWTLVGRYYGSAPIGRRGWFNFRSDVFIITDAGIVPFSEMRSNGGEDGDSSRDLKYLTSKLGRYYTDLTRNSDTFGWAATLYPRGNMLVVNVPASATVLGNYYQFVMNLNTGSWGRFREWNGLCWTVFDKRLYFGTHDGRVVLADDGTLDNGQPIKCDARQAYNYFDDGRGAGTADKHFHFGTFVMEANGTPPLSAEINTNFENTKPEYVGNLPGGVGAEWNVAEWDVDFWASDDGKTQNWTVSFGKMGYAGSVWLRAYLQGERIKWYATRIVFDRSRGINVL